MLRTQGYSSPANSAANSSAAAVLAAEIPLPSIWLNRMQGVDLSGLFLTDRAISGDGNRLFPAGRGTDPGPPGDSPGRRVSFFKQDVD
jgi:hypothetical protein